MMTKAVFGYIGLDSHYTLKRDQGVPDAPTAENVR